MNTKELCNHRNEMGVLEIVDYKDKCICLRCRSMFVLCDIDADEITELDTHDVINSVKVYNNRLTSSDIATLYDMSIDDLRVEYIVANEIQRLNENMYSPYKMMVPSQMSPFGYGTSQYNNQPFNPSMHLGPIEDHYIDSTNVRKAEVVTKPKNKKSVKTEV